LFIAVSATTCAAYGVASLAPLNQAEPPDAQVNTFHFPSVILTIVLLNEAKI
jgi:hypothetical protein